MDGPHSTCDNIVFNERMHNANLNTCMGGPPSSALHLLCIGANLFGTFVGIDVASNVLCTSWISIYKGTCRMEVYPKAIPPISGALS